MFFEDAATVAVEATRRILTAAGTAVAAHGTFRMVLAGGRTPLRTYRLLSQATADCWYLYFSDERCLPPDHASATAGLPRSPG